MASSKYPLMLIYIAKIVLDFEVLMGDVLYNIGLIIAKISDMLK